MEFTIPVFDTEIDTEDLGESGKNLFGAIAGGVGLLGIVAVAKYIWNRGTDVAGVDSNLPEGV